MRRLACGLGTLSSAAIMSGDGLPDMPPGGNDSENLASAGMHISRQTPNSMLSDSATGRLGSFGTTSTGKSTACL